MLTRTAPDRLAHLSMHVTLLAYTEWEGKKNRTHRPIHGHLLLCISER